VYAPEPTSAYQALDSFVKLDGIIANPVNCLDDDERSEAGALDMLAHLK